VCMFSERLQIVVTPEQRRRLTATARRRGMSVSALVREAIDARVGQAPRETRLRAVAEMAATKGGRFLTVEEMERIVDDEREANFPLAPRRRR